jgi:hypothetical protein
MPSEPPEQSLVLKTKIHEKFNSARLNPSQPIEVTSLIEHFNDLKETIA